MGTTDTMGTIAHMFHGVDMVYGLASGTYGQGRSSMFATAVMNLKGGPGKTAVVNGLAHAHAARAEEAASSAAITAAAADEAVLIGDMDPQGNTTRHLTGYHI